MNENRPLFQRFFTQSLWYMGANVAARAITVLLTPLYTRVLATEDFGKLAYANTVGALLAIVLAFGLGAAITRLVPDDATPSAVVGNVVGFFLTVALGCTLMLEAMGDVGFLDVVLDLPYATLGRYVVWGAWLSVFSLVPIHLFTVTERPARVAVLSVASVAVQLGFVLWFVVLRDEGVAGVLRANLFAQASLAAVSLFLVRGELKLGLDWQRLRPMLAMTLPLVPHLIANWALSISDRLIIERVSGKTALGVYSLAYMLNTGAAMITSAVTQALSPHFIREAKAGRTDRIAALGDVCVATAVGVTSVLLVSAPEIVTLLAPATEYQRALAYVPWVLAGAVFQSIYLVSSQGTWYAMQTSAVPVITAVAAGVNIVLNLVFVPRFGPIAAAIDTAVAYALLALLHDRLAHASFAVPWHYRRWLAFAGVFAAAVMIATLRLRA